MITWKQRVVPFLLTGLVVGGLISGQLAAASASPTLPAKTTRQVLALALGAEPRAHSGIIEQESNLGLPDLSGVLGASVNGTASATTDTSNPAATALELLGSDQKYRVAFAPGKARVQRYLPSAEQDVVLNGASLWLWDSRSGGAATHLSVSGLPKRTAAERARAAKTLRDARELAGDLTPSVTPEQIAAQALRAVRHDGTVTLSAGKPMWVAGRSTYTLTVAPKQAQALIGAISIAVDSKTGQVLRFEVRTRAGNQLAYRIGYTSIIYGEPAADTFAFTPPPGAKVTEHKLTLSELRDQVHAAKQRLVTVDPTDLIDSLAGEHGLAGASGGTSLDRAAAPVQRATDGVRVSGQGFATVVRIPGAKVSAELKSPQVRRLTTPTAGGARVLSTTLLNVLIEPNGDVMVGSVPVSVLVAAER